jgi:hypothetical protein
MEIKQSEVHRHVFQCLVELFWGCDPLHDFIMLRSLQTPYKPQDFMTFTFVKLLEELQIALISADWVQYNEVNISQLKIKGTKEKKKTHLIKKSREQSVASSTGDSIFSWWWMASPFQQPCPLDAREVESCHMLPISVNHRWLNTSNLLPQQNTSNRDSYSLERCWFSSSARRTRWALIGL